MDASRLFLLVALSISASESSGINASECPTLDWETFNFTEGEGFYAVPLVLYRSNLPDEAFTWFRNGSQIVNISSDENDRVLSHGRGLLFLDALIADSGNYFVRRMFPSGQCFNHPVRINVFSPEGNKTFLSGEIKHSGRDKIIPCPKHISYPCKTFKGSYTWYKDFSLIPNEHKEELVVENAIKDDEGLYTCVCTWTYNQKSYNTSGSRRLVIVESSVYSDVVILSPTNREQFADEGSGITLNCSIFCGINVKQECNATWRVNGDPVSNKDGYNQTTKTEINSLKSTISTATLTIEKVSAEDFQKEFECFGVAFFTNNSTFLILKRREPITPLVIGGVCVLLFCVFAAVLVKCFAIDLALFFRPYSPLSRHSKDFRMYDAYVVYQMQGLDKATEDSLSRFVTEVLPSVLEEKCGYRLFIYGRDDIPGEDRLELVEDCMKQSRRLMVILTPGPGAGSESKDQHLSSPQTAEIGGFDWQVGLHHALVQREMSVILIQLGDPGPQGYTHLPPGLQHLIRESAPIRWPEGSRGTESWNSRFWKKVRYLMPARPARKCAPSAII